MELAEVILRTDITHFHVDAEDFCKLVDFNHLCSDNWPIWIASKNGNPVGWYNEYDEIAGIIAIAHKRCELAAGKIIPPFSAARQPELVSRIT
ncbi:MAG: hypothetical protein GZ092_12935 [Polaromonas sp.]|nr:hypothetical protein [Polaromonas sp.]